MYKLDYSNPQHEPRTNWQMVRDAFLGLAMIGLAAFGLLFNLMCSFARSSPKSGGFSVADPWDRSGKIMGADLFRSGLRRISHGRPKA